MKERYAALLRALNVGGHSVIRMSDLKALFESLGYTDVVTYIQTGNVVFSTEEPRLKLNRQIEDAIDRKAGYRTNAFIFSGDELQEAADNNPFEPERLDSQQHCHLMFLSEEPAKDRIAELMMMQGQEYRFHVHRKVFYYAYDREFAGTRRRPINFEKILGVTGTARTWKVVDKLIELSVKSM